VSSPERGPEITGPDLTGPDLTSPEVATEVPAGPTRRYPRSAGLSAGAVAAGVVVVLLSSSPVWMRVTLKIAAGEVKLSGGNAAPAAVPVALVAAAGLIAIALVRAWVRRILAVLVAASGVGVSIAAVRVLAGPVSAARGSSKVSGAGEVASVHLTAVPYVCLLGAVLIVAGAIAIALTCGRWPQPGRRYERTNVAAGRPTDAWDALERGEDPTSG
jgi:uncharacterized membrane protein (TIGR02234 family)